MKEEIDLSANAPIYSLFSPNPTSQALTTCLVVLNPDS